MSTTAEKENVANVPRDQIGYRAHTLKKLIALQEELGDGAIQKMLQAEIASVKKRTAEVLALDKQLRQHRRETDSVRSELRRYQDLKQKADTVCQTLQISIKRRDELTRSMKDEMQENREKAIEQTREKVQAFKESSEARRKAVEQAQQENDELRRQCDELQESFKREYDKFQEELQNMFTPSEELKALQSKAQEVDELQELLKKKEQENSACVTGAAMMEQQIQWYEKQFEEFEAISVDPEAVKVIMEKQRASGEQRVNDARKEAESIKKKRVEVEAELQDLRVQFAALQKKLVQAESNKKTAEKNCRQAQLRLKK
eukprot:gene9188-6465_t